MVSGIGYINNGHFFPLVVAFIILRTSEIRLWWQQAKKAVSCGPSPQQHPPDPPGGS